MHLKPLAPPQLSWSAPNVSGPVHPPHTSALSASSSKPSCYKQSSPVANITLFILWKKLHQHTITVFMQSKRKLNGPIFAMTRLKLTHEAISVHFGGGGQGRICTHVPKQLGLITCISEFLKYLISFLKL